MRMIKIRQTAVIEFLAPAKDMPLGPLEESKRLEFEKEMMQSLKEQCASGEGVAAAVSCQVEAEVIDV